MIRFTTYLSFKKKNVIGLVALLEQLWNEFGDVLITMVEVGLTMAMS